MNKLHDYWKLDSGRFRPGFIIDRSCRLYVPFYLINRMGTSKVPDFSPYGNHGTIVGAHYPGIRTVGCGINRMINGDMETGDPPTGYWIKGTPLVFERSSAQKRGGSYSAHLVTDAQTEGFVQDVDSLPNDRWYRTSFWYYLVQGQLLAQLYAQGSLGSVIKTSPTGAWNYGEYLWYKVPGKAYYEVIFQDGGGGGDLRLEVYIDDVTVEEVVAREALGCGFDGIDDYINFGNVSLGPNAITILIWFYTGWDINAQSSFKEVFKKSHSINLNREPNSSFLTYKRDIMLSTGAEPYWDLHFGSQPRWNLYTYTYDAATGIEILYRNGDLYAQRATLGGTIVDSGYDLLLGGTGGKYWYGNVGEFAIFDRAWSAIEVKGYYERTRYRYGNFLA